MFIDIAISGDRNVIKKVASKVLNYKDLTIEIQHMYSVKTKVVAVTIGATRTILQSFRKYLKNGEARNQGTARNSHIVHSTHTP
jgi:hypothetical protein